MNLARAKLVLIIAFLGLNLFLAFHLFQPDTGRWARLAVTARELRQVEDHLAQNNYFLEVAISRAVYKSAFLTVSPDMERQKAVVESLAGLTATYREEGEYLLYRVPGREVEVYPSGLTRLYFHPGEELAVEASTREEQELRRHVEKFLHEYDLKPEQAVYDYLELVPGEQMILHYYQDFDGTPLFAGYLRVSLEQGRVAAVELYWLEPEQWLQEREMKVITVTDALLRLVKELGASREPCRIIKADLGFFSHEYNAEKWEVPPVWRFLVEPGGAYYVNAYTGNLEADLEIKRNSTNRGE